MAVCEFVGAGVLWVLGWLCGLGYDKSSIIQVFSTKGWSTFLKIFVNELLEHKNSNPRQDTNKGKKQPGLHTSVLV